MSKLRGERPAQFEALNLKAAAWHEQRGRPEEAVYHYVQAQAWDRVVGITDRAGRGLFEEGRWDTLAGWLDSIPAEQLAAQPRLVLWKAKVLHYLNQLDQALQLLAAPVRSFEAAGDWSSLAEALITKGMCLRLKGDYPAAKEALSRARSLLLEYDGPMSALTEARKELGITYGACGEFDLAAQELKGVLDIYEAQGDSYNIAHVSDQLGTSLLFAGELAKAAGYLERAVARWKKLGNEARLLQTLNNLGLLYYMQGLWPEAEAMFREAAERAASTGARYVHAYATASLADVERDRGNLDEAVRLYQQSLDLAHELDERFLRVYDLSALADAFRMKGERAAALSLVDQAVSEAREHGGVYEMGLCQTALGLIYREDGRLKEAVDCLEDAVALLKQGDAKRDLARACFHLADAYFGLKRKRIALDCLETAARVVQELGYDHFLAVEAARTPLLVQYAAANKAADGYYGRLLKQVKAGGAQTEAAPEDAGDGRLPAIEAYGFGNVRVVVAGREVSDLEWRSEKSKEMFFFFLANRRPLRKEEVIAALWPDLPDDKTTSSFHSTLYRLRQALHPECIAKDSGCYLLNPLASIRFDVEELQSAVKEAEGGEPGDGELERLEKAVALYRGGFGQDFYTEWAESLRWQLEEQYLRLLATLASAYSRRGDHKRSASLCQQVLAVDEYNEAAWYRLMRSYLAAGEVEAAKFAYRRYSELLREGMGDEPSPEFEELRALMAKEPGA
ncbi:MAG: tetratricopeptide repeat protein [Chloroflexi bacterium]|nr:tetratricopeptide repeat protein [Chloroflexota bacterium]